MTVSNIIPCPNCGTQMMSGDGCTECPHFDQPGDCYCAYCQPDLQVPNEDPIVLTLTTPKQTATLQNLRAHIAKCITLMEQVEGTLREACAHVNTINPPTPEEIDNCPICDVDTKAARITEQLSSLSYRVSAYVERGKKQ